MIPVAALAIARRLPWAWIAAAAGALALILTAWRWHDSRLDAAVMAERGKWEAISAANALAVAKAEAAWAARVNDAAAALSRSQASVAALSGKHSTIIKEYYRANPARNVLCLAPDRVRAVQERDAAIAQAAADTSGQ